MDLIDRDDLLLNCQEAMFLKDLTLEQKAHIITERLDNAPTVDAIPLSVIEEIKAEFVKRYPKNYAGDLESGGNSCVFSLDKVLQIIDEKVKEVCVL